MAPEKLTQSTNDRINRLAGDTSKKFNRMKDELTTIGRNIEGYLVQIAESMNTINHDDLLSETEINFNEKVEVITFAVVTNLVTICRIRTRL